jgi:hypothetical protein
MAGILAPGSPYLPRLPILVDSGIVAAFVPGYSSGTATEFHRTSLAQGAQQSCVGSPPFEQKPVFVAGPLDYRNSSY